MKEFRYSVQTNGAEVVAYFESLSDALAFATIRTAAYKKGILVVYDRQEHFIVADFWKGNMELTDDIIDEDGEINKYRRYYLGAWIDQDAKRA